MSSDVNCSDAPPGTAEYLANLSTSSIVLLSLAGVVTFITLAIYIEELVFLHRHLQGWRADKPRWLLGLFPVFSATSFLGVIIPRSAVLDDLVAAGYLGICLFLFLKMLIHHYDGVDSMCKKLVEHKIQLRGPPCCCCCFCLPSINVTKSAIWWIEVMVLQTAVCRPILMYIAAVLWSDGRYHPGKLTPTNAYFYISIVNGVSTLTAMYGLLLVFRLSRQPLKKEGIVPKFICLQLVLIFSNLQNILLGMLETAGTLPCTEILNSNVRAANLNHLLLIVQMLFLSLVARYYYRRNYFNYMETHPLLSESDPESGSLLGDSTPNLNTNLSNGSTPASHTPVFRCSSFPT